MDINKAKIILEKSGKKYSLAQTKAIMEIINKLVAIDYGTYKKLKNNKN